MPAPGTGIARTTRGAGGQPAAGARFCQKPGGERERPPRGLPKQLEMFSEQGSGVPICNPEDENQDPPGDARNDLIVGFVC